MLQSMGSQRAEHDRATEQEHLTSQEKRKTNLLINSLNEQFRMLLEVILGEHDCFQGQTVLPLEMILLSCSGKTQVEGAIDDFSSRGNTHLHKKFI